MEKWKSFWSRFFGGPRRTAREERVLAYIVHRVDGGARLQEVVRDEYVRRMTTEDEVRRILAADPRIIEGARVRMRRDLDVRGSTLRRSSRVGDRPVETPEAGSVGSAQEGRDRT